MDFKLKETKLAHTCSWISLGRSFHLVRIVYMLTLILLMQLTDIKKNKKIIDIKPGKMMIFWCIKATKIISFCRRYKKVARLRSRDENHSLSAGAVQIGRIKMGNVAKSVINHYTIINLKLGFSFPIECIICF